MAHWSGASNRLDRDLSGRFGNEAYAAEELIAELSAAFLCAEYQIDGDLRHAGYIASWLRILKNDNKAVFKAAALAQKSADYIKALATITAPAVAEELIAA
jgi:antirestriction protein ArdC